MAPGSICIAIPVTSLRLLPEFLESGVIATLMMEEEEDYKLEEEKDNNLEEDYQNWKRKGITNWML